MAKQNGFDEVDDGGAFVVESVECFEVEAQVGVVGTALIFAEDQSVGAGCLKWRTRLAERESDPRTRRRHRHPRPRGRHQPGVFAAGCKTCGPVSS